MRQSGNLYAYVMNYKESFSDDRGHGKFNISIREKEPLTRGEKSTEPKQRRN